LILCKTDEGLSDQQIAQSVYVGAATVGRVRKRFAEEGLESALSERPRPGKSRKLDGKQEAHLVAIACSKAPPGHTHWTLQLLADKVVELEFADSIALETVRQMFKKTNSNPGRKNSGASRR
jgi:transposase